jgi:hypothetical protein
MVDHPFNKTNQIYSGRLVLSASFITFESLRSKEFLHRKHHVERLSVQKIADECGVHRLTVWRAMVVLGVQVRAATSKIPKKLQRYPARKKRVVAGDCDDE